MKRTARVAGMLTAVGLVMGGCTAAGSGAQQEATSPLDQYLGANALAPAVDPAKDRKVQELVADCMKKAGFEYRPIDPTQLSTQVVQLDDKHDRAWTQKYGYGISTTDQTRREYTDPNEEVTKNMSGSEREAYHKALHGAGGGYSVSVGGPGPVEGEVVGPKPSTGTTGPKDTGCYGKASTEVYGERKLDFSDFGELFTALDKLGQRVDADPRVAPLLTGWSECMAGAGYPGMTKMDQARSGIFAEFAAANGWTFTAGDGQIGGQAATSTGTPAAPDPAKIADLRKREITLALADWDCRQEYEKAAGQVRLELEKVFVAEHEAELKRYRDAVNGGR